MGVAWDLVGYNGMMGFCENEGLMKPQNGLILLLNILNMIFLAMDLGVSYFKIFQDKPRFKQHRCWFFFISSGMNQSKV